MARRKNQYVQETLSLSFDHAQVTGTTTWKIWKAPWAGKLSRASYINVTGLAADGTNQFALTIQNGSTVMASGVGNVSPDAIAANTFEDFANSATAADLVFAAGDVISLVATEAAAATLPAGRVTLEVVRT